MAPLTISGTIYNNLDKPVGDITVTAFDKDLRKEQELGSTITNAQGFYQIEYRREAFNKAEHKKAADIFIKVTLIRGDLVIEEFGPSDVLHNVADNVVIDFKIGKEKSFRGIPEFDALEATIAPLLIGQGDDANPNLRIVDLKEEEQIKDITFLANETGEAPERIALLPKAETLHAKTQIATAIFYGLFRSGLPTEWEKLLLIDSLSLKNALNNAIEQNIISAGYKDEIEETIKKLNGFAVDRVFSDGSPNGGLRTMLGSVRLTPEQQNAFVSTVYANEATPEKLWDELKAQAGFSEEDVQKLQTVFKLNQFTGNVPALSTQLYLESLGSPDLGEVKLLTKRSKHDWNELIINLINRGELTDFPAGIEGSNQEEKAENYAAALTLQAKQLYPTTFFAARLQGDDDDIFDGTKGDLLTFFAKNPEFDLKTNKKIDDLNLDDDEFNDKEATKKELKRIVRLYKLTDDYAPLSELYKAKISSATDIVSWYSETTFVSTFTGKLENANFIYQKAQHIDKQSGILALNLRMQNDIPMYAINGSPDPTPAVAGVSRSATAPSADYQEFFGDNNLCDCEHCRSVYSPAAYFVDILSQLRKASKPPEPIPDNYKDPAYKALQERRPDLTKILLTCKNTNTPLPYIDLVNELLENKVAGTSNDYQTTLTAAELAAYPENTNTHVYDELAKSNISFKLPFNLPLEETRIYLDKLGIKRHELMEAFIIKGQNNYQDKAIAIATEYLGLSKEEREILTATGAAALPAIPLANVNDFLNDTGLTYKELSQLLGCSFINPIDPDANIRKITIVSIDPKKPATCDINLLKISGETTNAEKIANPFIRLWKKLGWELYDLDEALVVFGAIDDDLLTKLSHVARLKNEYALSVSQILPLWSNIGTKPYIDFSKESQPTLPSLYETLFQNKKVTNPLNKAFEKPTSLSGTLSEQTDTIKAALGISQQEFDLLISKLISDDLTLANLSTLYRYATLSRMLRLSVEELLIAEELTKKMPTDSPFTDGATTLLFIDKIKLIRSSGFNWVELKRLLKDPDLSQAPDDNTINDVLTSLREGLKKIEAEFVITELPELPADPTTGQLEDYEKIKKEIEDLKARKLISQRNIITDTLSNHFRTESKIIDVLITSIEETKDSSFNYVEFIKSEGPLFSQNTATNEIEWKFPAVKLTYLSLSKTWNRLSSLLSKLKITADEFVYFHQVNTEEKLGIKGIWDLPTAGSNLFSAFEKLYHLIRFRNKLSTPPLNWFTVFDCAADALPDKDKFIASFIALSKIPKVTIDFLLGQDIGEFQFPVDVLKGENLLAVLHCAKTADLLGVKVEKLATLAEDEITSISPASKIAQSLLKAKYDETSWLEVIKPISNQLRNKKRDALTAYLIGNKSYKDTNSLYADLLIDTEMAACMMTSRIKQAISSMQLFVDRCLLNLETVEVDEEETKIQLSEEFATQWEKWRKMYRVWEANRKVFLYPENWIEPDLRDDKSPFFKELESKLRQNEVTDEVAKDALLGYLEKLDAVANLEVVGLFPDELTKITHVIGRTRNIPNQYYYRKLQQNVWTAWEKMDLDIEGDHILPVVWNSRLMVFWGMFTEKQVEKNEGFKVPATGDTIPNPVIYLEMKLAWSEYKNGKWGSKKVSKESMEITRGWAFDIIDKGGFGSYGLEAVANATGPNAPSGTPSGSSTNTKNPTKTQIKPLKKESFFLNSSIEMGQLNIKLVGKFKESLIQHKNFCFDGCHGVPILKSGDAILSINLPTGTVIDAPVIKELPESPFSVYSYGIFGNSKYPLQLFDKTPGTFQLVPTYHEIEKLKPNPFFYTNGRNGFYVNVRDRIRLPDIFWGDSNGLINVNRRSSRENSQETNSLNAAPSSFVGRKYSFQIFYHPYVCEYIKTLNTEGIDGLYKAIIQNKEEEEIFTPTQYNPNKEIVKEPYPVEKVDFDYSGTYSIYNWELFFHIPLLMATRLMQNQKFEEARLWFHYIFDPTKAATKPADFWVTKPFKDEVENEIPTIAELIETGGDDLKAQLDYAANNPFKPHGLARLRLSAYMRTTVMKYIDNLIAWGDQLFERDTLETLNEATLLYIMAANLLGKKPENIPPRAEAEEVSFEDIKDKLNEFNNAKVKVKEEIQALISASDETTTAAAAPPPLWYFCFPKNDKLLGYWDTVADRLFKLRNCMNIQGVVRQLPLFEPPIDPALLVKAAAAGLDLNTVLNDMSAALPNYRFQVMLQKANELCSDVKGLGNELLSALEKQDAENLSLLRSSHEIKMLELMRDIKVSQRDEAKENLDGMNKSKAVLEERRKYYESRDITNFYEKAYLASIPVAMDFQNKQIGAQTLASISSSAPDITIGAFSSGATYGGSNIGKVLQLSAGTFGQLSNIFNMIGSLSNTYGGYQRRMDDWKFQAKSAELELKQMDKQIVAAEIRLAIAEKDLENHDVQIENAKEVDDYMRGKFTNAELYDYMVGQLSTVYFQSYQLAYQTAKRAEKCYQHELGVTSAAPFIQFGYWDSLKKGLLSGEKLQYDLRRLENAYMEQNTREFEITKHISLKQLDPYQLLVLREEGACAITLPEELFDLDFPGHYFRRIKSVSITIPCIVGPYTSVNATLRLESSSTRISAKIAEGYPKDANSEDTRFISNSTVTTSIATSNAQNDSGVFQLNFQDERFLPFERAGAVSTWKLELMEEKQLRQFDYNTISDVVVHLNYTAREDAALKAAAITNLTTLTNTLGGVEFQRLFSIKHDFPNEWHKWQQSVGVGQSLSIKLEKHHFPYFAQLGGIEIVNTIEKNKPRVYAQKNGIIDLATPKKLTLTNPSSQGGDLSSELEKDKDDWFLVVNYQITIPS